MPSFANPNTLKEHANAQKTKKIKRETEAWAGSEASRWQGVLGQPGLTKRGQVAVSGPGGGEGVWRSKPSAAFRCTHTAKLS